MVNVLESTKGGVKVNFHIWVPYTVFFFGFGLKLGEKRTKFRTERIQVLVENLLTVFRRFFCWRWQALRCLQTTWVHARYSPYSQVLTTILCTNLLIICISKIVIYFLHNLHIKILSNHTTKENLSTDKCSTDLSVMGILFRDCFIFHIEDQLSPLQTLEVRTPVIRSRL